MLAAIAVRSSHLIGWGVLSVGLPRKYRDQLSEERELIEEGGELNTQPNMEAYQEGWGGTSRGVNEPAFMSCTERWCSY